MRSFLTFLACAAIVTSPASALAAAPEPPSTAASSTSVQDLSTGDVSTYIETTHYSSASDAADADAAAVAQKQAAADAMQGAAEAPSEQSSEAKAVPAAQPTGYPGFPYPMPRPTFTYPFPYPTPTFYPTPRGNVRAAILTRSRGTSPRPAQRFAFLNCSPPGGTHPYTNQACAELSRAGGDPNRLFGTGGYCPRIYDPVTVTATVIWNNRYITYQRTFGNPCELRSATGVVFEF